MLTMLTYNKSESGWQVYVPKKKNKENPIIKKKGFIFEESLDTAPSLF